MSTGVIKKEDERVKASPSRVCGEGSSQVILKPNYQEVAAALVSLAQ